MFLFMLHRIVTRIAGGMFIGYIDYARKLKYQLRYLVKLQSNFIRVPTYKEHFSAALKTVKENIVRKPACPRTKNSKTCDIYQPALGPRGGL